MGIKGILNWIMGVCLSIKYGKMCKQCALCNSSGDELEK